MLWIEAVRQLSTDLTEPYELEFVWRSLHGLDKLTWLNLMREEILAAELKSLKEVSARLQRNEPPQYIVGWAEFCGLKFKVDPRVLIPRPETEELVQLILSENPNDNLSVLDVGTGSGAIAVALAKSRPSWLVAASDISDAALAVAQENARTNDVVIDLVKSNVLDQVRENFDIIVSNPPYIAPSSVSEVQTSVQIYEPHLALFAEHEGLEVYEKIAQQTKNRTKKIYLEIGYNQTAVIREIFKGRKIRVFKDFSGLDRMVQIINEN